MKADIAEVKAEVARNVLALNTVELTERGREFIQQQLVADKQQLATDKQRLFHYEQRLLNYEQDRRAQTAGNTSSGNFIHFSEISFVYFLFTSLI